MTLKNVRKTAKEAGIGLKGIKIKVLRDTDSLELGIYGYTPPDGKSIFLYPKAFTNKEILVKTIGHERIHVMQVKIYGAPTNNVMSRLFENGAEASENGWWQYYIRNGGK